jgi:hypothetical protein
MTSPTSTNPLDVPENRELLIALLDAAAKRYRKEACRLTFVPGQDETASLLAEDAETAEHLSAYFETYDRG